MKSRSVFFALVAILAIVLFAACGAGAPAATEAPVEELYRQDAPAEAPAQPLVEQKAAEGFVVPQPADAVAFPTMAPAVEIANQAGESIVVQTTNRKIIKNADMRLLVRDTDVAIDRSTQIITDLGGYIVSSRTWYQDYYGNNLKYASVTIGVPVDEFENVMRRLRGLAVKVVDENATGEDVTDKYVDLQSQLTNLESTRERIKEFLKEAKTVDEALRVNQELANIESQIEQIKGRMNFITDRSAFSTITINLEPEFPVLTATPTSTPRPTATPIPWKPVDTFNDAKGTVSVVYQGIANFLIWLVVVILPIILPPALILWAMWKLLNRKPKSIA